MCNWHQHLGTCNRRAVNAGPDCGERLLTPLWIVWCLCIQDLEAFKEALKMLSPNPPIHHSHDSTGSFRHPDLRLQMEVHEHLSCSKGKKIMTRLIMLPCLVQCMSGSW
jgi:hypothetical protein